MKNLTLNQKVMFVAFIVTLIIAAILGLMLYNSQIKPVKSNVESQFISELTAYSNSKMDLKIQGGIIGSAMLSLSPDVQQALQNTDKQAVYNFLKTLKKDYADKTNFRGVFSELIHADGQSLIRSWKLDEDAGNRLNDPLVKQVFDSKKAAGALGFGDRGVAITSITPVLKDKQLLGGVTMVLGVGSISRDFAKEYKGQDGAWIMLVDKQYVANKFGSTKAVDKLKKITDRYVIANNKWFADEVVEETKSIYQPIDGDAEYAYINKGRFVVDIPAYDEQGRVFGRQVFIQNESVFTEPLAKASSSAWQTLFESVIGIIILTVILSLMINRMIIRPLASVKETMAKIEETGDFSLRIQTDSNDEVGQTARAVNSHLEKVNLAIREANSVISALADGDLNKRIQQDYKGSLLELKTGVNQSSENVAETLQQIAGVMQQLRDGQFHVEIHHQAKGAFAEMLNSTSDAMHSLDQAISEINMVMNTVAKGEFKNRITSNVKGDLATLTNGINLTVSKLDEVISNIAEVMRAQSEGDLTQRINVECQGELLILKDSINSNADHLNAVINDIVIASNTVSTAADEVSRGSMSLSDSVQQQAASMEQTSATMKEMNEAISRNADNTLEVDKLEHELEESSKSAGEVMHNTIIAMSEIQESSQKISEIVSLIDSIAFQTNLLALNAAVEAARAGEQGRGFAVVAGEVRALAGKSADAAKEISTLINESVESVNKGTELAGKSEEVLQTMNDSIVEVTKMISDIASTSADQARGVGEVNQALGLIDDVTQNNAALVEETSAAAESMSDQAAKLKTTVRFFKTDQNTHRASATAMALPKK
ncbi:methyl-accepting chemotaxis protein [Thiomicrorhabdus indica]|uniref:methyl-accepting chemotaxis protein n=1 Tax=Thiomicrorhabdus indica TaxID=2267253 RepID=UPI002AA9136A|nr:methyl-accepting chemotaxis protein [Thiomicrorhabdus indica]